MSSVDHEHVRQLLEDPSLSYREIARQVGCSDWTVRSIARNLAGDNRPMKAAAPRSDDDSSDAKAWPVLAGVAALFAGAIWFAARRAPPEGGAMP